ncbi:MAG: hypothetical protein V5B40_11460 [Candidatus Accumulibacter meliphilus]|jgi:hypothetical protein|uniref:hypothetical protein n=1 Tax=Candidatus Accumulibacter meliphilus TaxID=2211374 RepID=UPI002FC36B47
MKNYQGGTQKYCPKCKEVRVCAAVNPTQLGLKSGQRWYRTQHSDIQYFRRGLVCQTCQHQWPSAEIPEQFLDELVELRNALKDIKQNAEAYSKESANASASLAKLSESLSVLKALKVYKEQT